ATHVPWAFKDAESNREFKDFLEAFETFDRRMLLLGGPGSGKTTTNLHIAEELIKQALKDPSAPIPLLVNLSKFQPNAPGKSRLPFSHGERPDKEQVDKRFERWLISEFSSNPLISREIATTWIQQGRIAALLDGLDEVNDEYRAEVVRILNATYLRDYPKAVVVVCSRINEYQPLQDRKDTRLQLEGAVTLQPLTDTQIKKYLEESQATGLGEAFLTDQTLYQMAQTPLTLSMMTLAYGGSIPTVIPSHLTFTERRHHLMDAYVAKMLQRKERRDRNIQFDKSRDNDVPTKDYLYQPESINSYLGWLAIRLSVRMQTAVSLNSFYGFLNREIDKDRQSGVWWATAVSRALFLFVGALIAGAAVAPMTAQGGQQVLYFSVLGALLFVPVAWVFREDDNLKGVPNTLKNVSMGIIVAGAVLAGLGVGSIALSFVLPFGIPPLPMGILGICLCTAVLVPLSESSPESRRSGYWLFAWSMVAFGAGLLIMNGLKGSAYNWYIPAFSVAAIQTIFLLVSLRDDGWAGLGFAAAFVVGALVAIMASIWIIGDFTWQTSLLVCISIATLILGVSPRPILAFIGFIVFFGLGGIIGGHRGSIIGSLLYGGFFLIEELVASEHKSKHPLLARASDAGERFTDQCERAGDHYLLSPIVLRVVAITRCLPLRFSPFFQYAEGALLLKRSAGDIEFMHRLLRDYFALRDLQPLLIATDSNRRLQAIRNLGFQGEAAIEALAEFVRDSNPDVREAAASALGKITSPAVLPHIEVAFTDESPKVRRSAIISTRNLTESEKMRLLALVVDDEDISVQSALIEIVLGLAGYSWSSFSRNRGTEVAPRVMANLNKRSELRQILFQFVQERTEHTIRLVAIEIVNTLQDPNSVPSLIAALLDRRFTFRDDAARALGAIGDSRAIKALMKASADRDKSLRHAARTALDDIESKNERVRF
ncbi:MAG TPA: HEAT repeat domain-containing protein, partial [Pyrinomonadaceae bacterium]|nr:HEAT repeat domain-containing protein [Pyrinomonadaceae bacterium]